MLLVSWRGSRVCRRLHTGTASATCHAGGTTAPRDHERFWRRRQNSYFLATHAATSWWCPHERLVSRLTLATRSLTHRAPACVDCMADFGIDSKIQTPRPRVRGLHRESFPAPVNFYPPAYKCRAASGPNATKWQLAGIRPAPRMRGRDGHPPQNSAEGLTPPPACAVAEESPAAGKLLPARLPRRRPPSGDSTRGFVTGYKTERPSRPAPPATTKDCHGAVTIQFAGSPTAPHERLSRRRDTTTREFRAGAKLLPAPSERTPIRISQTRWCFC